MQNLLEALIKKNEHQDFRELIAFVAEKVTGVIQRNDVIQFFRHYCDHQKKSKAFRTTSSMFNFIKKIQELFSVDHHLALIHRYAIAKYRYYLIRMDGKTIEAITLSEYLDRRDQHALQRGNARAPLRIDFMPFYDFSPTIRDIHSVGNGIRFLNRYMSSGIFSRPREWLDKSFSFLKMHHYQGQR